jgi:hypothetical protein
MFAVVLVAMVVYVALVGVARAAAFTYGTIKDVARDGAEALETTVLDIGDAPPAAPKTDKPSSPSPSSPGSGGDAGEAATISMNPVLFVGSDPREGRRRDEGSDAATRFVV